MNIINLSEFGNEITQHGNTIRKYATFIPLKNIFYFSFFKKKIRIMSRNSLTYITYNILWLIFQLLVEINCQMKKQWNFHTATNINNKLYILYGTYIVNYLLLNEFICLDLYK